MPNTTFTYDIAGKLVEVNDHRDVNDGGGLTKYKYDRMGRVSEVNDIFGRTVKYEYNSKGLRTKLVYPGTTADVNYFYDALGRVTQINRGASPAARYQYDELGRRTLVTYGNDANIAYQYDIGDRLTKLTNNINSTTAIAFDYADYDRVGNRKSMKIADANTQIYDYDKLYQLIFADYNDGNSRSYRYDKLGNRTLMTNGSQTTYETTKLNQYSRINAVNYQYDNSGNLTFDGTYTYYYDFENRLTEVNDINNQRVVTYKYDFKGRRVAKIVGSTTATYLYDGDSIIVEYHGTSWKRYYYGPGIDEPICMWKSPGIVYYYHFDGLGSVVALSNTSHLITERYSYDVFGEPNRTSTVGNRFMFTGREYDSETGNYYYRARYYHPTIGRFMQTDPILYRYFHRTRFYLSNTNRFMKKNHIHYRIGFDLYTYVNNNPIKYRDPYGLYLTCMQTCFDQVSNALGGNPQYMTSCQNCCLDNLSSDAEDCEEKKQGAICAIEAIKDFSPDAPGPQPIPGPDDVGDFLLLRSILTLIFLTICITKAYRWRT